MFTSYSRRFTWDHVKAWVYPRWSQLYHSVPTLPLPLQLYGVFYVCRVLETMSYEGPSLSMWFPSFWGLVLHALLLCILVDIYMSTLRNNYQDQRESMNMDMEFINGVHSVPCPIYYRPEYSMTWWGLEHLYIFHDGRRSEKVLSILHKRFPVMRGAAAPPPSITFMSRFYPNLWLCNQLSSSEFLAPVLGNDYWRYVPISLLDARILRPMRYMTGGTIEAIRMAYVSSKAPGMLLGSNSRSKTGWAINVGGGFNQAGQQQSQHFCVYADISIGITALMQMSCAQEQLKHIMVLDCDALRGSGYSNAQDKRIYQSLGVHVSCVDVFHESNPMHIEPSHVQMSPQDTKIPYTSQQTPQQVLQQLHAFLQQVETSTPAHRPQLLIYVAGYNLLVDDAWGHLAWSPDVLIQRDEMVFAFALKCHIPICMLLGGGYTSHAHQVIANSITNLQQKFGLVHTL